jgi:hypothetical protein
MDLHAFLLLLCAIDMCDRKSTGFSQRLPRATKKFERRAI